MTHPCNSLCRHGVRLELTTSGPEQSEGDLLHRHVVDSSSIESIGYESSTAVLEIEFSEGGLYQYFMVPPSVFHRLMKADSKGRFFAECIRNTFQFEQL